MNEPAGPEPTGPEPARIRPYLRSGSIRGPSRRDDASPPPPAGPARPRPFVLTAGRVRPADPDISLETQVTAVPGAGGGLPAGSLPAELRAILSLCAEPISVAELSARIPLHLGVTKVLVGDLRVAGYLDVHSSDVADPSDPQLILRVIRGLRALA